MPCLRICLRRLRVNHTGRYAAEFPFVSMCGPERNFVSVDDTPIVFTQVMEEGDGGTALSFNHAGRFLAAEFRPSEVCMVAEGEAAGRVYHPASDNAGGFGLVADKLSILWTQVRSIGYKGNRSM